MYEYRHPTPIKKKPNDSMHDTMVKKERTRIERFKQLFPHSTIYLQKYRMGPIILTKGLL